MKKEDIKAVLEFGFKLEFPYKSKIESWYGNISINKIDDLYYIHPFNITLYDIDEAINYFLDKAITSKNIGYIQNRLDKKVDFEEDYDLEKPNKDLKKLFKDEGKIVDEEAKQFNIQIMALPKLEDAISEFKNIIDNFNIEIISEYLKSFERKYSILDPYIGVHFVFEPDGTTEVTHEFRSGIDAKDFTLKELNYCKSHNSNGYKFKNVEVTLHLRGDEEYYRYELNI